MTVRELIAALEQFHPSLPVWIATCNSAGDYGEGAALSVQLSNGATEVFITDEATEEA